VSILAASNLSEELRPRAELHLLTNKQEEEGQDSEENRPPIKVMFIEANEEKKEKEKVQIHRDEITQEQGKFNAMKTTQVIQENNGQ
jgi:hypothetical protein